VPKFVGDHKLDFIGCKGFDERIAEHDTVGAEHAGNVRVGLLRLTAHIHAQNVDVIHAETFRETTQAFLHRALQGRKFVKERREIHRHNECR